MMFRCLIDLVLKTEQLFYWCKPSHTTHFAFRSPPLFTRPPSTSYLVYLSSKFPLLSLVIPVRNCAAIVEILSLSFLTGYLSTFRENVGVLCASPMRPKVGSFRTSARLSMNSTKSSTLGFRFCSQIR